MILCGGGSRNPTLVKMLKKYAAPAKVIVMDDLGINADAKEAISFAILAAHTIIGIPNNVPSATGAKKPVILGKIIPPSTTMNIIMNRSKLTTEKRNTQNGRYRPPFDARSCRYNQLSGHACCAGSRKRKKTYCRRRRYDCRKFPAGRPTLLCRRRNQRPSRRSRCIRMPTDLRCFAKACSGHHRRRPPALVRSIEGAEDSPKAGAERYYKKTHQSKRCCCRYCRLRHNTLCPRRDEKGSAGWRRRRFL